jgi:hypothetical protein
MTWTLSLAVIAGLDPAIAINVARPCPVKRDGRVKPGHDIPIMEEFMRESALRTAMAGAILGAVCFAAPAGALTLAAPGQLSAAANTLEARQEVGWCNWRGCVAGYPAWPGQPYGLYQTYPYVGYNIVPGGYYYKPLVWPRAWGYRPW